MKSKYNLNDIKDIVESNFKKYDSILSPYFFTSNPSNFSTERLNNLADNIRRLPYPDYLMTNIKKDIVIRYSDLKDHLENIRILYDSFSFIEMSTDADKIKDHKLSYIFPKKQTKMVFNKHFFENHIPIVNQSKRYANDFMNFIILKSNELLILLINPTNIEKINILMNSIFLLIGKPGLGKTAFLNYLFSVWSKKLKESYKIIWIRIDLGLASSIRRETVENLLYSKFIRIFCEYYVGINPDFNKYFLISFGESANNFLRKRHETLDNKKINDMVRFFVSCLERFSDELKKIGKG